MKKYLLTAISLICLVSGLLFISCTEDDMNDENLMYSYVAHSNDFNYGPFETAIKQALGGAERVPGGNDDIVIKACDKCYEEMKAQIKDKSGKVTIYKKRYPDNKQKELKTYKF